jgi:hypothetical protein
MFTIGDFARHGRGSVRMLRHYDATGLLRPARVDPATGYRYYTAGRLATSFASTHASSAPNRTQRVVVPPNSIRQLARKRSALGSPAARISSRWRVKLWEASSRRCLLRAPAQNPERSKSASPNLWRVGAHTCTCLGEK